MKNMKLKKELRAVGAGENETEQLLKIARTMSSVKFKGLSPATKKRLAPDKKVSKPPRTWQWTLAGSMAAACLLIFVAQSALPGSWLYSIKRGTEEARAVVQPEFKDNLIEERENEVEQLKIKKADPAVLEEAKKNYEKKAESVLDSDTDYQPRYEWSRRWYERFRKNRENSDQENNSNNSSNFYERRR